MKKIILLTVLLFLVKVSYARTIDARNVITPGTVSQDLLTTDLQNKLNTLEITDGTTSSVNTKTLYFNPGSGFHLTIDGDTTEVNLGSAFKYFITDDGTVEATGGEDILELSGSTNVSVLKKDSKHIQFDLDTRTFILNNHTYSGNYFEDSFDNGNDNTEISNINYSATDGIYNEWQNIDNGGDNAEYSNTYSYSSPNSCKIIKNSIAFKVVNTGTGIAKIRFYSLLDYNNDISTYIKVWGDYERTKQILNFYNYLNSGNQWNHVNSQSPVETTFSYPSWQLVEIDINQDTQTLSVNIGGVLIADNIPYADTTYSSVAVVELTKAYSGNLQFVDDFSYNNADYSKNDVIFTYRNNVDDYTDIFSLNKDSYLAQFKRFRLPTDVDFVLNTGGGETGEIVYDTNEQNIYCYDGSEYYIAGGKRTALRDKQVCFYVGDSIFDNFTDFIDWKNNADEGDYCIIVDDFTAPNGSEFHLGEIRQKRGSTANVVTNFLTADTGEVIVIYNNENDEDDEDKYGTIVSPDIDDSDLGILVNINKLKNTDIDKTKPLENGDILVYNSSKKAWVNSTSSNSQVIEYGNIYLLYPYGIKTTQVFYRPDHYRLFTSGNYGAGRYILTYYGIYDDTNNYNIFATDLSDPNMTIEIGNGARWVLNSTTNIVAGFGGYDIGNSSRCRSIIFVNLDTNTKEVSSDYGRDYVCHAGFTYNKNRDKYYLYEGSVQELDVIGESGFYTSSNNKSYVYDKSTNTWTQSDTYLDLFKKVMNYTDTPESEIGINVIAFSYGDYNYVLGNFCEGQYDSNNDSWTYSHLNYNIKINTSNNDVTYIGSIASPYVYYNDVSNTTLYMYGSVECYVGGSTTFTRARLTPTVYAFDYSSDTFIYYPNYPIKSDKVFIFKKSNYLYIYNLDQSQGFGAYRLNLTNPVQWEEVSSGTEYKYVYNNSYTVTPSITATLNPQNYATGEPLKQIVIKQSNQTECVFKTYEYNNGVQPAYMSSFSYQIIGQ